jgi:hypothetical protein
MSGHYQQFTQSRESLYLALRGVAEVWEMSGAWQHYKGFFDPARPTTLPRRVDKRTAQGLQEIIRSISNWIASATFEENPEHRALACARGDSQFQQFMSSVDKPEKKRRRRQPCQLKP